MPLFYGSLFSGIGGMDLGFDRAGLKCKWQVEIDPYARRVLEKHWPEVPKHDDIRTFKDIPYVDIVAGGFPCQDISYAGKGAGLAGERSGLFYEAMRVVREVGPGIVVLENVAALLTRGLDAVLGTLASLGYDAEWNCIPAAYVGAPHIRDRVFVVAYANGWRLKKQQERNSDEEARKQAQCGHDTVRRGDDVANADSERCPRRENVRKIAGKACAKKGGQAIERTARWEAEPAVGRVVDGFPGRVDRIRGLGNAVVPQVAELIARRIVAQVEP